MTMDEQPASYFTRYHAMHSKFRECLPGLDRLLYIHILASTPGVVKGALIAKDLGLRGWTKAAGIAHVSGGEVRARFARLEAAGLLCLYRMGRGRRIKIAFPFEVFANKDEKTSVFGPFRPVRETALPTFGTGAGNRTTISADRGGKPPGIIDVCREKQNNESGLPSTLSLSLRDCRHRGATA